jgi:class 3 adenylate cyclase/tetratricopeptide (TPR) repeat protein
LVTTNASAAEVLKPYVPRLLISWLRETPEARHRQIPGSLAFVDISGFTQLTERLSRKGKVGSEEISDTLDDCFGQLLAVAYDYGAGVVKWGGDAVLLLFVDDDHAPRACRASWEMHRLLDRIGNLRTSAGRVRLRMSTGIHSGEVDFFVTDEPHRELVLTGPAADATIAMETAADAGETVVSKAAATLLEPALRGKPKGGGIVLAAAPDVALRPAGDAPDATGLPLERFFSPLVREHILEQVDEPEHRMVTAAFVEFEDADELLERSGPDALADALDECIGNVQEAAAEHDVAVFDTDPTPGGGKTMLVAGAPRSRGGDEERMLRTLRRILDRAGKLPLRAGVNVGRVFADEFGPEYRRTYTVKGDAVNLAARLMAKASAGQVLAARAVLDRSRTAFEVGAVPPFRVKGKAEPVEAALVGDPLRTAETEAAATPLVGRERELAVLVETIEAARAGKGGLVEIVGEEGMGKSKLVDAACAAASGLTVVRAVGEEYESSTPYFALRGPLRELLGASGPALERRVVDAAPQLLPWLPLLAIPLGLDLPATPETEQLGEKFRKAQLERSTCELLDAVASGPALLVAEDTHWLDDASLDLVRGLLGRSWLVMTTRLPSGAPLAEHAETVELQPLGAAAVEQLIHAATESNPLPGHEVKALAERAGGNPLFLTELLASARELDPAALPDSVEALVTAQVDRLRPGDRALLRQASVLGRTFDSELLASTLEQDDRLDETTWQRLSGFLVREPGGQVRFRHALIRDTAYEGLPYRRRRILHARAGETIERLAGKHPEREAEHLSLHFFHAQRFEPAWRYSRLAGEHARSIYAHAEAVDFYVRAVDSARHLRDVPVAEVAAVCESLGDSLDRLGLFGESGDAYRDARRRRRGDPIAEAGLMLKEGWTTEREGRLPQALRWFSRGLKLLEGVAGGEARRAELLAGYATVRQMQGRSADAVRWCHRAIAAAEEAGERKALAQAYYVLDWAYMEMGRSAEAVSLPLALDIYEELGDLSNQAGVRELMGGFAYYEGRWETAVDLYERAREDYGKVGAPVLRATDTFNIAEIRCDQGRLDEAGELLDDALRVWRAAGWPPMVAIATRQLGSVALREGRLRDAMRLFEEAREVFIEVGAQHQVIDTDGRIAECLLLQGSEGGLELAREALARAGEQSVHVPMLQRVVGYGLQQTGDRAGARAAFEDSLRIARERQAEYQVALTLDALARLGGDGAEALAAERDSILTELAVVALPPAPSGISTN